MATKTMTVFLAFLLMIPALVVAAEIRTGDSTVVAANEKIASNLYIAGGDVTGAGTVMGDEIVAGGTVILSGAVLNDVAAAGGTVTIPAKISGDLRVMGGTVMVSGEVMGDVVAIGGQTDLSGPRIGGDVFWAGSDLSITAPVTGNLHLRGAHVTIDAPVTGSIYFTGDTLTLGSRAVIDGALSYSSPKAVVMKDGSKVAGAVQHDASTALPDKNTLPAIISLSLFAKFLMTFFCALVLGLMLNGYAKELTVEAALQPMAELGRGFVTVVVLPVAAILLLISVVGIPLGVLGFLLFISALIYGSIAAPIIIGSILHRAIQKTPDFRVNWMTILTGALVYTLLGIVPVVGGLAKTVLVLIAIGAAVKIHWEILKEWR